MDEIPRLITAIDWRLVATIGVPTLVVVAGWFLVHRLNAQRDLATRKREARLKALESAYMRIATSSNRPFTDKSMDDIETFVSEIQLYGTPRQIELMSAIVEGFKTRHGVSYDDILADLRDTIRKELSLEPVTGPVWWFRFRRLPKNETANTPPNADAPPSGGSCL
jgi:hypothetical protein